MISVNLDRHASYVITSTLGTIACWELWDGCSAVGKRKLSLVRGIPDSDFRLCYVHYDISSNVDLANSKMRWQKRKLRIQSSFLRSGLSSKSSIHFIYLYHLDTLRLSISSTAPTRSTYAPSLYHTTSTLYFFRSVSPASGPSK